MKVLELLQTMGVPENIDPHKFIMRSLEQLQHQLIRIASNEIRIASSLSNAQNGIYISSVADVNEEFNIISRVSDKKAR